MSDAKKKTPAEKAATARFSWAEKGDPYSALDFTILLLKNPKVKPPGFTDQEIASYFGRVPLFASLESELSALTNSLRGKKRRSTKSSKYGSLTSTLSSWVSKKPTALPLDTEKFVDSLPKPEASEEPPKEEKELETKLVPKTKPRRDWRNFGQKQKSSRTKRRDTEKEALETAGGDDADSNAQLDTARAPPKVRKRKSSDGFIRGKTGKSGTSSGKSDSAAGSKSVKASRARTPERTPVKSRPAKTMDRKDDTPGNPATAVPLLTSPRPPASEKPSNTPSRSRFGVAKTQKQLLEDQDRLAAEEAEKEKLLMEKKASYTPSMWKTDDAILPERYKSPRKSKADEIEETIPSEKPSYTVSSWRKDPKRPRTFSKEAVPAGPNTKTRQVSREEKREQIAKVYYEKTTALGLKFEEIDINAARQSWQQKIDSTTQSNNPSISGTMSKFSKSGSQISTFSAKAKASIRILTPLFQNSKNLYDETSTLQALEALLKIADDPQGTIVLGNMKLYENLNDLLMRKKRPSANLLGKIYDVLAAMSTMYAKLGNKQSFLNSGILVLMVEHVFSFIVSVDKDGMLYEDAGDKVGKTYEESSRIEAVASATGLLKALVEFAQRSSTNAQENFVCAGGLHMLLILSYCNLRRASRVARVVLQRFELRELMYLSSPALNLDLPDEIAQSSIMEHYEHALKEETLRRVERTRREHAVIRKHIDEATQNTPRTQNADERRQRLNKWLEKRDLKAAEEREKYLKRKAAEDEVQKEIERMEAEKARIEAETRKEIAEKQRLLLVARYDGSKKEATEMQRRELLALEEERRRRKEENGNSMKLWLGAKRRREIADDKKREENERNERNQRDLKKKLSVLATKNAYTEYNR
jgi:hypothetical protein